MNTFTSDATLRQVPTHIQVYLRDTITIIDDTFGEGYSTDHPELVARFIQAACIDSASAVLAQGMKGIAEAILDA